MAEYGIASELLDRQTISALEPNILPVYKVGLLHTQTASVNSPGDVVKAYARMFPGAGGEIRQSDIRAIMPDGKGWHVVLADGAIRRAMSWWRWDRGPRICCGRSAIVFRWHLSAAITASSSRTRHARCDVRSMTPKAAFLMTPMEQGIRVTVRGRADRPRCALLVRAARSGGAARARRGRIRRCGRRTWRGARPTLPDSLPMIGPAPRHSGLWLAFGNQHIGFTTGPATGAAIAAMIGGETPPFDAAAFSPSRYL